MPPTESHIPIQHRQLGRGSTFWHNWDGDTSKLPDALFESLCHNILKDRARRNRIAHVTFEARQDQHDSDENSEGRADGSVDL